MGIWLGKVTFDGLVEEIVTEKDFLKVPVDKGIILGFHDVIVRCESRSRLILLRDKRYL